MGLHEVLSEISSPCKVLILLDSEGERLNTSFLRGAIYTQNKNIIRIGKIDTGKKEKKY